MYEKQKCLEPIVLEKEEFDKYKWEFLKSIFSKHKDVSIIKLNIETIETFTD